MPQIYLGLGSNIDPKTYYLQQAANLIEENFNTSVIASSVYQTKAFKNTNQPVFFNVCLGLNTDVAATSVLNTVLKIEQQLGRPKQRKVWDNRQIDIDILLYGTQIINQPNLTIPHYDLHQRDFFLIPLLEINPELIEPKSGESLLRLLASIPQSLKTDLEKTPNFSLKQTQS